jgi:pyruvate-formate lyase-activating enzyme
MDLTDFLAVRSVPFAGVFLGVTRRCPLHCAHCSTNSMMSSGEPDDAWLRLLVSSFTPDDRPEVLFLSGGEPLLRAGLVADLAERARAVGTKVAMITGAYFAEGPTPPALQRAMDAVDLLSVSIDEYHEQEVSRAAVFDLVERRLEAGRLANLQTVGSSSDDPYLVELVADVEARFGHRLPVLVGQLGPAGRGAALFDGGASGEDGVAVANPRRVRTQAPVVVPAPAPCSFASWPVVTFDGTIAACCNQWVVDGPVPEHLRLGHASTTTWPQLRAAGERRAALRAIRVYGPEAIAAGAGQATGGYCSTCVTCGPTEPFSEQADRVTSSAAFELLEALTIEADRGAVLRSTMPGFEDCATWGSDSATGRPEGAEADPIGRVGRALAGIVP